jgi:peroxiredoxin Q/BCP
MAKKTIKKKTAKKVAKKKTAPKKAVKKAPAKKKAAKKASPKKTAAPKKKPAAKKVAPKAVSKAPAPSSSNTVIGSGPHPMLGSTPPALTLSNQKDEAINLAKALTETPVSVLYFYPKDDTPGCTVEACSFRDNLNRLKSAGVSVYGVSPDSSASHRKFIEKYGLNFDLLVDTDHKLADTFQVWKQKQFMGKSYMGIERATFLYKNGKVAKAWQPVKVEGHVEDVLSSIQQLK